ncbi:unnamed protein product [Clonostachys chloroleuca]|uniref:N-acetyltransferase domain-containing protein n=1 Tax=Clonostachys chloroleuca TaxID=1926264 RepID=A0AA35MD85_9HYPO|nr:unnamed protein product [Clonostachys chloroleuca]
MATPAPLHDMSSVSIRPVTPDDAAAICAIYNPYVASTTISFEEAAVEPMEMAQRIAIVEAAELPWLVATAGGKLIGYTYATRWHARPAYRTSVESSVYIDQQVTRSGAGKALYSALLDELRARGLHVVIGVVALPNDGSVAFHERFGFHKVAHFSEIGRKFGRWIDVGYWELKLED